MIDDLDTKIIDDLVEKLKSMPSSKEQFVNCIACGREWILLHDSGVSAKKLREFRLNFTCPDGDGCRTDDGA